MTTNWVRKSPAPRKVLASGAALLLAAGLAAGCGNVNNDRAGTYGAQSNGTGGTAAQRQYAAQNGMDAGTVREDGGWRVEEAERAAEKVAALAGVRSANILMTDRTAYVAAVLDSGRNELSRETEQRIAEQVRAVAPDLQNVYVSTNPDFVERINTYAEDVRQGRPVAGLVEQLNEIVQRVFPEAR